MVEWQSENSTIQAKQIHAMPFSRSAEIFMTTGRLLDGLV
jgi:hypothetical protein